MTVRHGLVGLSVLSLAATRVAAAAPPEGPVPVTLTLEQARAMARDHAPALVATRARTAIARGGLDGASILLPFNPTAQIGAGPRITDDETTTDVDISVAQRFQLGGQRDARIDIARAEIERAEASADEVQRRLLYEVSVSFVRVLHARMAHEVATDSASVAQSLVRVVRRKREVGEVAGLDVNVASVTLARTRADQRRIASRRARAIGALRALLGIDAEREVIVDGRLQDRRSHELRSLMAAISTRADLRGLQAAKKKAVAEEALGDARRWPDLGVFAGYGREEDANIFTAGISVWLPVFDRGQGERATAIARQRAHQLQLDNTNRAVATELAAAFAAHAHLEGAVESFEKTALPRLQENLDLATRAYRSGAIPIGELLSLQRELVAARVAYVDLLLEANLAVIDLESLAGVLK